MSFLNNILGNPDPADFSKLVKSGAQVIDVRTAGEFASGHINGALNIPLDTLADGITRLKKDSTIIACCASGIRSAAACNILRKNGFSEVYNGGSWMRLKRKIG